MKYLKTIVVLMLLIGFPLITVYYLTTGNNYGKKNYESAKPKGSFKELCNSIDLPEGKTFLLVSTKKSLNKDVDQLVKNVAFELDKEPSFVIKYLADSVYIDLKDQGSKAELDCNLNSNNMVLVDNLGRIRNEYGYRQKDFNKLMEDLPFVIPRKIKRDIVEKNYETK